MIYHFSDINHTYMWYLVYSLIMYFPFNWYTVLMMKLRICVRDFSAVQAVRLGTNYKPIVKLILRCLGGLRPPRVFLLLGGLCPPSTNLSWGTKSP